MADPARVGRLAGLLEAAGGAHRAELGGLDPDRPEWYAAHVHPENSEHVGFEPTIALVADLLRTSASRRASPSSFAAMRGRSDPPPQLNRAHASVPRSGEGEREEALVHTLEHLDDVEGPLREGCGDLHPARDRTGSRSRRTGAGS